MQLVHASNSVMTQKANHNLNQSGSMKIKHMEILLYILFKWKIYILKRVLKPKWN